MSKKIFKAIWLVAVIVFLASLIFIMGISYRYFSGTQKERLKNQIELAVQGVECAGIEYFEGLEANDYRITWIDKDGKVLYDSRADKDSMENHLEREEVREALENGYGESSRYSDTLAEKQLYAAKRLSDGSVVRMSVVQMAVWTLLIGFAQPICIVAVLAFALSLILASGIAKKIVRPINKIDLENPEQYYDNEEYSEVEPLLRHISEQQKQLKRDREQIEKTALIRQEFSANVSHELKTPLHAIAGYAELLETGLVREDDIKPFASKIREESLRMTGLVEDIIELTKLDNGGAEFPREICDLLRVAENAADSLEAVAEKAGVTVTVQGVSVAISGVPQLLYSIIYDLCDNAIKYNKNGGSVEIEVGQADNRAVVRVRDTGIGIPKDCKDRIFERFYRVDKSRSKEVGGTGLGLSIVKHAVMVHGGSIIVNSTVGKGSEFVVTFPM